LNPIDGILLQTESIKINKLNLERKKFYLIDKKPLFGKVEFIFINGSNVFIIARVFESLFVRKLFAYKLMNTNRYTLINDKSIKYHKEFNAFNYEKELFLIKFTK